MAESSKIVQQVAGKLTVRCCIDYIYNVLYIMENSRSTANCLFGNLMLYKRNSILWKYIKIITAPPEIDTAPPEIKNAPSEIKINQKSDLDFWRCGQVLSGKRLPCKQNLASYLIHNFSEKSI